MTPVDFTALVFVSITASSYLCVLLFDQDNTQGRNYTHLQILQVLKMRDISVINPLLRLKFIDGYSLMEK